MAERYRRFGGMIICTVHNTGAGKQDDKPLVKANYTLLDLCSSLMSLESCLAR